MEMTKHNYYRLYGLHCAAWAIGDGNEHQERYQKKRGIRTVCAYTTAPPSSLGGTSTSATRTLERASLRLLIFIAVEEGLNQ